MRLTRGLWQSGIVATLLASGLVACPAPAPEPIKLIGQFTPSQRQVRKCGSFEVNAEISSYAGVSPDKISFVYNFGDGSPAQTTTLNNVQHIFVQEKNSNYVVNAKALIEGQTVPGLEANLLVRVNPGADCAYIVEFNNPSGAKLSAQRVKALAADIVAETGGEPLATFSQVMQGFAARYAPNELTMLQNRTEVSSVEISSVGDLNATQTGLNDNPGLDRIDQRNLPVDGVYNYTTTGLGVDIYVLDTGVRATHTELAGRVAPGWNVFSLDTDTQDGNGHGTHVAAIAAGKSVGVAKDAQVIPVKVYDGANSGTDEWAFIAGLDWVMANRSLVRRSVINFSSSLNYVGEKLTRLDKAMRQVAQAGIPLVVAGGNRFMDACLSSPAKNALGSPSIFAVGATDSNDARASFSNGGACISLYAPGSNIRSASHENDIDFKLESGTSQAAPFVTGAIAAYLETNPNATAAQVKTAILNSATPGIPSGSSSNRLLYVERPPVVRVQPPNAVLSVGETINFTALIDGDIGSNQNINWVFSEGGIQSSGSTLKLTAPSIPGIYTLTASSAANSSIRFVVPIKVEGGVLLSSSRTNILLGETQRINAQAIGLANPSLTWEITPNTAGVLQNSSNSGVDFVPTEARRYIVRVSSLADATKTASLEMNVAAVVTVLASPKSAGVLVNQIQNLSATVQNTANTGVTWSVTPTTNATLTPNGNTASFSASSAGVYSITATSVDNPSKSDTSTITVTTAPVVLVSVSPTSETMQTGVVKNFSATVQNASNTAVVWTVAPTANTNLTQNGNNVSLSATTAGSYTLTATSAADPSKSATASVTVTNPPASVAVTVSPSTNTIYTNTDQALSATVQNTSNTAVSWTVLPTNNATLTPNGNNATFRASVAGVYNITATSSADPSKSFTSVMTVTDPPPIIVQVSPSSNTIFTNTDQGISVTVQNASNSSVTWSVSPTSNATLTPNGGNITFRASSAGVYTITATSNQNSNFKASSTITVNTPPPVSVSLNPTTATLMLGATQQLTPTVTNASNTNVAWTSSNSAVASVSGTGLVTALTVGNATITATSAADPSKSASASITTRDAVRVTPTTATLQINANQAFSADVFGLASSNVTWSVTPTTGVNLSGGTSTATFSSSQAGTYTLTATSSADPSKTASATITVLPNVTVTLNPSSSAALDPNQVLNLSASVGGSANTAVTWSVSPSANTTLTPNGNSVAFSSSLAGSYTITATSVANTARSASLTVTVNRKLTLDRTSISTFVNTNEVLNATLLGFTSQDVQWGVQPLDNATLTQNGSSATFRASQTGTWTVTVTSVQDSSKTATATIQVSQNIAINPNAAIINLNSIRIFAAAVNPTIGNGVTWSVNPTAGVTLIPNGNLVTFLSSQREIYTLKATSIANSGIFQTVNVIVVDLKTIAAGSNHSFALKTDETLWAFGDNSAGNLGDGTSNSRTTPIQVMTRVSSITAGYYFSLALKTDGTLWAFGDNSRGQLGDGTTTNRSTPVQVMTGVSSVAAGGFHSLALKTDSSLWVFGRNNNGQLGDGTTTNRSTPVQVMTGVSSIAAGDGTSLALKTDGTLWAFGYNLFGQLGDGTTTNRSTPVQVMMGVMSISTSGYHSLALKTDGTLWAFGLNNNGQLGDGTTTTRITPVQVMTGVSSIAVGLYHSLALKTDGTLWAFGDNSYGQLGDGTTTTRITPVQVMTGVSSMAVGWSHSLALKADGTLWAFGRNGNGEFALGGGQLGDGTTTDRSTPVQIMSGVMLP